MYIFFLLASGVPPASPGGIAPGGPGVFLLA
jgi:hypothetical protein